MNFKHLSITILMLMSFITGGIDTTFAKEQLSPEAIAIINNSSGALMRTQRLLSASLPANILRIRVADESQLTDQVKAVLRNYGFDPANEEYDILIGLNNDHNAYAMGLIKERGDDFGYTHGMVLEIGTKINSAYHIKFRYSSDLFSKPVDGEIIRLDDKNFSIKQYITNENIAKFVIDNYDSDHLSYWKGELGWHQLDHQPDNGNILLGSTQQLRFHKLLNSIQPGMNMIPIHVDNEEASREGILVGLFVGTVQTFISDSSQLRLKFQEEIGAEYSNATKNFYGQTELRSTLTYQKAPSKLAWEIGAGVKAQKHSLGTQYSPFVDLGIGRARKWRLGVRAEYYKGTLNNDSEYNLINPELGINDPTARIYFQYFTK